MRKAPLNERIRKNITYKCNMCKIPKLFTVYQLCIFPKQLYSNQSLWLYIARQAGSILILIINHD